MIVTKNWLSEFVNLDDVSNEKLYETFNSIGLEVDSISSFTIPKKVVVGKILSCQKHPDADKLNVCQIDVGGDIKQIVCGASNVVDATYVAVALVGAVLPENFEIKDATLRGVDSAGMVCASSEIGLPNMGKGIMILDDSIGNLEVGRELGSYTQIIDTVIELELTANRGDCLSIHGVARDLSVALSKEMKPFAYKSTHKEKLGVARIADIQSKGDIEADLSYVLANANRIYSTFLINIRLAMVNISLDDNLSNILSYATHTTGVILRAYNGDKLKNEESRIKLKVEALEAGLIYIKSQDETISMLGVNQNSSVEAKDGDSLLLLEASYIYPDTLVEAVSKGSYERDDLYYKTSRGSEPDIEFGLEFVSKLLELNSECRCYEGYLNVTSSWEKLRLGIDTKDINSIIGKDISKRNIISILSALGFDITNSGGEHFVAVIPRFRHDIKHIQDITEEIVRIVGINNIPSKPLLFTEQNRRNSTISTYEFKKSLRHRAVGVGLYENVSYVFSDCKVLSKYGFGCTNKKLELLNPIAEDLNTLRSTILINMLEAVKRNVNYTAKSVGLFEIGAVFNEMRVQKDKIAIVWSGQDEVESISNSGKPKKIDFASFVKKVSLIIGEFELVSSKERNGLIHPYQSADIIYQGQRCGYISKLHPTVQNDYDIPDTFFAEIDFDAILPTHINAKPISKFQGVYKDLSLVVDASLEYSKVKEIISELNLNILKAYYPIDIYQDNELGDKKSLTIRFFIQSLEKTLKDKDIDDIMGMIVSILEREFGATLR